MAKYSYTRKGSEHSSGISSIWTHWDLLWSLSFRNLKARYAATFLGLLWTFIQPIFNLIIFTLLFGRFIKVDTGDVPYPLFALTGMAAWGHFSYLVNNGSTALVEYQNVITKVAFPKILLPLSKAITANVDLLVMILISYSLMAIFGYFPSWQILFLPIFLFLSTVIGIGIAFWFSTLSIRYRDLHHTISYFLSLIMWMTPVAYPASIIPEGFKFIYFLNPVAGLVEGFRWCILGTPIPDWRFIIPIGLMCLVFIFGLAFFKSSEKRIADYI
ncbi:MAG: ABC transporter permease [Bacteroidota bacterium]